MRQGSFIWVLLFGFFAIVSAFAAEAPQQIYQCRGERLSAKGDSLGSVHVGAGGQMVKSTQLLGFYLHSVRANPIDPDDYSIVGLDYGRLNSSGKIRKDLKKEYIPFNAGLTGGGCSYRVTLPRNLVDLKAGTAFKGLFESKCRSFKPESITLSCSKEILE